MGKHSHHWLALLAIAIILLPSSVAATIDQVFYVYETADGSEPPYITDVIRQIDELGLDGRAFDDDRDTENLQAAIGAARVAGLPQIVLLEDYKVVRTMQPPADDADDVTQEAFTAELLEAVK